MHLTFYTKDVTTFLLYFLFPSAGQKPHYSMTGLVYSGIQEVLNSSIFKLTKICMVSFLSTVSDDLIVCLNSLFIFARLLLGGKKKILFWLLKKNFLKGKNIHKLTKTSVLHTFSTSNTWGYIEDKNQIFPLYLKYNSTNYMGQITPN